MDQPLEIILGVGEAGIDTDASSPGAAGSFYAKLYDGSFDVRGYDSMDEALTALAFDAGLGK